MTVIHIGSSVRSTTRKNETTAGWLARKLSPANSSLHPVLFKFRADVSNSHKEEFVTELRKLKDLPCVMDSRLVVGGPTITDPIERSQGFQYALLSYHRDRQALADYQASDEHHSVTSRLLWPFKEDVIRFDFEVTGEDDSAILPIQSLVGI
ncbi:hypothetical protein GQX73_g3632 [Xylaria multiplex]|uniref:Stress-response A/B barrel domain-containing protein n=1 Tax=Xylaria multiplex TaxID=323545 RepID=A0A7C8N716_9PEZI|nr:hypothetical protein GQX73_g3632 [Xylaria multiplex]